jgi:hypothetical protein
MSQNFRLSRFALRFLVFGIYIFFLPITFSCSIPNLENGSCTDARNVVRELYSFHFGNQMIPSVDALKLREKFLTQNLIQNLQGRVESKTDYFTQTDDYPKAFRVGECSVVEDDKKVAIQVVLFWRDDTRNEQKEVLVDAVKHNNDWLVDNVQIKN